MATGTANYDTTMGISIGHVQSMINSIGKYQSTIQRACNRALNYDEYKNHINKAIKGNQTRTALKNRISSIQDKQNNLVKQLNQFQTKLKDIEAAYKGQDSKFTF